jgi:hypothetical protein
MNCAGVERCLDAFVDNEVSPAGRSEVERHLEQCQSCRDRVAFALWLKRSLKQEAQVTAPSELRQRVQASLREEQAYARRIDANWRSTAAVAALALCVFGVGGALEFRGRAAQASVVSPLLEDVVRAHARTYPAEVAHGDQVSEYFQQRVGFEVRPIEFADAGVGGRRAVALRYEAGERRITVVAFRPPPHAALSGVTAEADGRQVRLVQVQGHVVPMVEHDGVVYAVVSDHDADDPLRLVSRASLR